MNKTTVTNQDLWVMLLSTIRYSLGRSTYMPDYCISLYEDYGKFLSQHQRKQILDEIKQAVELAESCNRTVGMKCDHETWLKFGQGQGQGGQGSQKPATDSSGGQTQLPPPPKTPPVRIIKEGDTSRAGKKGK